MLRKVLCASTISYVRNPFNHFKNCSGAGKNSFGSMLTEQIQDVGKISKRDILPIAVSQTRLDSAFQPQGGVRLVPAFCCKRGQPEEVIAT